ncbi:hypothetical protein D0466_15260 [Peribacillus glennii]|uniref:Uncharacterized protein n=1 Tax=Peribacillus glennii TaxID=2303991 RepID=A0A372LA65_9BACI|nr:hypothetical protein D0466_15260 [Peribacillus glennii]
MYFGRWTGGLNVCWVRIGPRSRYEYSYVPLANGYSFSKVASKVPKKLIAGVCCYSHVDKLKLRVRIQMVS